ncbi:hypothetical protein FJTKL_14489 [Diaporthe vaccinii]|uniref:Uncharacterized protein n=1 Tax=Diaporthe vaccinii TaxID=105482 RepID=A0ABR4E7H3_9PEZI
MAYRWCLEAVQSYGVPNVGPVAALKGVGFIISISGKYVHKSETADDYGHIQVTSRSHRTRTALQQRAHKHLLQHHSGKLQASSGATAGGTALSARGRGCGTGAGGSRATDLVRNLDAVGGADLLSKGDCGSLIGLAAGADQAAGDVSEEVLVCADALRVGPAAGVGAAGEELRGAALLLKGSDNSHGRNCMVCD